MAVRIDITDPESASEAIRQAQAAIDGIQSKTVTTPAPKVTLDELDHLVASGLADDKGRILAPVWKILDALRTYRQSKDAA